MKIQNVVLAALVGAVVGTMFNQSAIGHTGSPSLTTFTSGNVLTAAQLNDNFSHLHNTLSAGIVNANISTSAAIAHSKLATPALVPKAFAYLVTACNLAAAADTVTCTLDDSSGVSSVKSSGTTGTARVTLSYTPTNAAFAVLATANSTEGYCNTLTHQTAAPNFVVVCRDNAGVATALAFSFMVMDSN